MVGFWKEYTVVKSHFYHIMAEDTCYPHEVTGDVNLAHLGKVAFARCLPCKVTFLFPSSIYQKWVTWYNQLSVWACSGIKLPPKRSSIYVCYWTSSVRKIVPFSPICLCVYIYSLSHLFRSSWTCLFHTLFVPVPTLAMGHPFRFLICSHPFVFWVFSYFLALQDAPGSSSISPTPALDSAISPRSPNTFY